MQHQNKRPIFISYSRQDLDRVKSIVRKIEHETGIKCWIDLNGIESGAQFQEVIIEAIDNAEVVLFVLSQNSMFSDYAKKEVLYAKKVGKRVVPISIDDMPMKGWFLFEFSMVDAINYENNEQRAKLFRDLKIWIANFKSKENDIKSTSFNKHNEGRDNITLVEKKETGEQSIEQNSVTTYNIKNSDFYRNKKKWIAIPLITIATVVLSIFLFKSNHNSIDSLNNGVVQSNDTMHVKEIMENDTEAYNSKEEKIENKSFNVAPTTPTQQDKTLKDQHNKHVDNIIDKHEQNNLTSTPQSISTEDADSKAISIISKFSTGMAQPSNADFIKLNELRNHVSATVRNKIDSFNQQWGY